MDINRCRCAPSECGKAIPIPLQHSLFHSSVHWLEQGKPDVHSAFGVLLGQCLAFLGQFLALRGTVPCTLGILPGTPRTVPSALGTVPGALGAVLGALGTVPGAHGVVPGTHGVLPDTEISNICRFWTML